MSEFIVLGLIPGTHFQLTFNCVLGLVACALIVLLGRQLRPVILCRNAVITLGVVATLRRAAQY